MFTSSQVMPSQAAQLLGATTPPTTTRDRLIDCALDLFYAHGFHAVGLDSILREVGISKQAFYKHFECKDDLAIEAIKRRDERELHAFNEQIAEFAPTGEPVALLLAMFDVVDRWFTQTDYTGCMFLTACLEFRSLHHPIHQAAAQHFVSAEASISQIASQAGAKDPVALARELIILLGGAVSYRAICGDNHAAKRARKLAELTIRAAIEE